MMNDKKRKNDGNTITNTGENKRVKELAEEKILSKARKFIVNVSEEKCGSLYKSTEKQTDSSGPSVPKKPPKKKKAKNKKGKNEHQQNTIMVKELALEYLQAWHSKDEHWKFVKNRSAWLIRYMYDTDKISEENFALLLEYLETLTGSIRERVITHAEGIIKDCDALEELKNEVSEAGIISYQRARQVLQIMV